MPEGESIETNDDSVNKAEAQEKAGAEDAAELKDRLLRLAAEFDNYKKRTAKDLGSASDKGRADVLARLLPVIDEFELAIGSMDLKQEHAKGISLIYSNFISALKSLGLRPMEIKGKYDPYRHEIMLAEESSEEEGTILEVVRKGYMLNDMMLRPASVIISKHTDDAEKGKESKKEIGE